MVHTDQIRAVVDEVYRRDSRRIFATLIRLIGDFDLAEESLHEAFAAAVEQWSRDGVPKNPRSWLVSTGRFKAIDTIRRRERFDASLADIAQKLERKSAAEERHADALDDDLDEARFNDDHLRLVFTCCHPALPPHSQVALTLREVCGLTTEEIASAFLSSPATIAQRIVRGKAKIRDAGIPFQVPAVAELPERLESVLSVVYLVFNEGYAASSGDSLTRPDLSGEAIRLGRVLLDLLPDPEVMGLLALMLLHESRREARTGPTGQLVLLEDQDRTRWDAQLIAQGKALVAQAFAGGRVGAYTLQAAISSVHADAPSAEATNWSRIVALYDLLQRATPSPVVELNRAVALAMRDGAEAGLAVVDAILARGDLSNYHLAHAARADLCRRLNRMEDARDSYQRALSLAKQEPERQFLTKRLRELAN